MENDNQTNQIDVNLSAAVERLDTWADSIVKSLPNIVVALIIFITLYLIARLVAHFIRKQFSSRGRSNLGDVLAGAAKGFIIILAGLLSLTTVVPSLNLGDLVAGLGISSVAIGFAFKDILQNWLAGLLILLRQPFEIGDQIEVNNYLGVVERIETRATILKTFDSQRVVIPNSEIYTNSLVVKTAYELRRLEYDIGIGYGDDTRQACAAIEKAVLSIDGVEKDPAPQTLIWDLAASWVTVRTRWWIQHKKVDLVEIRSKVIEAIKTTLDDEKIDMPYETQVHLFHDQTEDNDGDRSRQREGWPDDDDSGTTPQWKAREKLAADPK